MIESATTAQSAIPEKPSATITVTPGGTDRISSSGLTGSVVEVLQVALWPIVALVVAILYRQAIRRASAHDHDPWNQ
jgi:hypothetical protein